jgi:hypothetical protein
VGRNVRQFHSEHDHSVVTYSDESNEALARWVSTQRVVFGKGLMDDSRKQRLDDVNFTWRVRGDSSHASDADDAAADDAATDTAAGTV